MNGGTKSIKINIGDKAGKQRHQFRPHLKDDSSSKNSPSDMWKFTMSKIKGMAYKSLARGSRFVSDYEVLCWLGSGGFGSVAQVRHKLEDKDYAVKVIPIHAVDENQIKENKFIQEARTLAKVSTGHMNVIRFYHSWVEPMTPKLQEYISDSIDETDELDSFGESFTHSENFAGFDDTFLYSQDPSVESDIGEPFSPMSISTSTPTISSPQNYQDSSENLFHENIDNSFNSLFGRPLLLETSGNISEFSQNVPEENYSTESQETGTKSLVDGSEINNDEKASHVLFLQMELCTSQTLREWIDERTSNAEKQFDFEERLYIFHQVLSGVEHIHQQGFIHRDIKPGNIFMTSGNAVKVGDFGLSALSEQHSDSELITPRRKTPKHSFQATIHERKHTSGVGTYLYAAPEQLEKDVNYGLSADVFALGIVLFELLHPFSTGMERANVLQEVRCCKIPKSFKIKYPKIAEIVKSCISSPCTRPHVSQLLTHDVFNRYQSHHELNLRRQFAKEMEEKDEIIISLKHKIKELQGIIDKPKQLEVK